MEMAPNISYLSVFLTLAFRDVTIWSKSRRGALYYVNSEMNDLFFLYFSISIMFLNLDTYTTETNKKLTPLP